MRTFFKQQTARDAKYLAFIRKQTCLLKSPECLGNIQAHHEGAHGTGIKASDYDAIPVCCGHHFKIHAEGKSVLSGIDVDAAKGRLREKYRGIHENKI